MHITTKKVVTGLLLTQGIIFLTYAICITLKNTHVNNSFMTSEIRSERNHTHHIQITEKMNASNDPSLRRNNEINTRTHDLNLDANANETQATKPEEKKLNIISNTINIEQHQLMKYKIYGYKFRSPIIIKKYKLMWFLNPKAASVSTRELLARMLNQTLFNDYKKDLDQLVKLKDYSLEEATSFLNDPEWTKVIILRDPKQRMLSSYLDKEQKYHDKNETSTFRKICCNDRSTRDMRNCEEHKFSFEEFIRLTRKCKPKNYHWQEQYDEIDDWRIINYVINFNNLAKDTERLLRKIGAWEKFGVTGYGVNGDSAIFQENNHHSTGANSKLDKYYTPKLRKIVKKRFSRDYDLLRRYFPNNY